jgi:peptidoglycan hydrolase CwlO-like protein
MFKECIKYAKALGQEFDSELVGLNKKIAELENELQAARSSVDSLSEKVLRAEEYQNQSNKYLCPACYVLDGALNDMEQQDSIYDDRDTLFCTACKHTDNVTEEK